MGRPNPPASSSGAATERLRRDDPPLGGGCAAAGSLVAGGEHLGTVHDDLPARRGRSMVVVLCILCCGACRCLGRACVR